MNNKRKPRSESFIEAAAAAAMAAALGYSVTSLMDGIYYLPLVPGMAVAAIAFTATRTALARIGSASSLPHAAEQSFPALSLADFASVGAPVGAVQPLVAGDDGEPLILDDMLGQPAPNSRIVQLFGPLQPRPSAGELADRVDDHIARKGEAAAPDDSAAMFDSLEQLRRSLR